jgi:hypothetical protein
MADKNREKGKEAEMPPGQINRQDRSREGGI